MAYKYPICDVFHWFCKIAKFFAPEPPIKISDAIKAIRRHAIDIHDSQNYSITHDGIRKIKDDGNLGEIVYRVKVNA